ncbi:MAG: hypothetical protein NTW87_09590 [Planctomycetota bacterium]|nr:hypothetical protein [Planctomycetota bacterium]
MKRWLFVLPILLCLVALGVWLGSAARERQELEPLVLTTGLSAPAAALPADALVLTVADGVALVPPFALRQDSSAAGGMTLVLPKGTGTRERTGRARLMLEVPAPQKGASAPAEPAQEKPAGKVSSPAPGPKGVTYCAWARVYWRDSCSNSACLKVGDGPERTFGNDSVYGCWHWVSAGQYALAPGKVFLTIAEREDGIALDQLLFTSDPKYAPAGPISRAGEGRGIRRFADDFSRSPGHGMEGWDLQSGKWNIAFTFDPNRIPCQYALEGVAAPAAGQDGASAVALVKSPPWYGCRLSFSFQPMKAGKYGAVLDRDAAAGEALYLGFRLGEGQATLEVDGEGLRSSTALRDAVRLNQWHHVVIERWAWVTRVWVDSRTVFTSYAAPPRAGQAGFFVSSGAAAFDDVELEETPWQADDGNALALPWTAGGDAKWYRTAGGTRALVGRSGSLAASLGGMGLEEIVLEEIPRPKGRFAVLAAGLDEERSGDAARVFRRPELAGGNGPPSAVLQVEGEEARLRCVAFRYGERVPKTYALGPYSFTQDEIPDESDYIDFTPEELRQMARSADADKDLRRQKMIPLVGNPSEELGLWLGERGSWHVHDGALHGAGPNAQLRHALEFAGDMAAHLKVRLPDARSVAEIELYSGPEAGMRVQVGAEQALAAAASGAAVSVPAPADGKWHELLVCVTGQSLAVTLDKNAAQQVSSRRGDGGRILLKVPQGRAEFDDIEFTAPQYGADGSVYDFQRQESDWWREGRWVPHAGNACALASHWISLLEAQGKGMLWNKRTFGQDLLVGFDVEENADWHGWHGPGEGHVHYPFDNICAVLAPASGRDVDHGYRLEVNSRNRSATVLYRNGKEVARVAQDGNFPIRYNGGHGPYSPRRNHITLVKRGALLRAIINGREVLRFTDPEPLVVNTAGVGGYDTRANFARVEVRTLEGAQGGEGKAPPGEKNKGS